MLAPTPSQLLADRGREVAPPLAAPSDDADEPRVSRRGAVVLAVVLAALVGWGASGLAPTAAIGLVVRTDKALTVLGADGRRLLTAKGGQISPDGSVVAAANRLADRRTRLVATDAATGETRWSRELSDRWSVRLVAEGGTSVVLGAPVSDLPIPYIAPWRTRTRIAIVTAAGTRRLDLAGNYEPEAMSRDGSSLFVIEYTPPEAPQTYQVRRLDLASGEVVDVFSPDAELQQAMGGTARTQVASADGRRLYTLYTLASPDGAHSHAFIHVLDLDDLWAHCIDLPAEFSGAGDATALALADDGGRLYVADRAAGAVAAIDTATLKTVSTAPLSPGEEGEAVAAAVAVNGPLFVSSGSRIDALDVETLTLTHSWPLERPVRALQLRGEGELAVAHQRELLTIDTETGAILGTEPWAAPSDIIGLGAAPGGIGGPREAFPCAC